MMEFGCTALLQVFSSSTPGDWGSVIDGFTLCAMLYICGHMSGGHLNPLISLGTCVLGYHPLFHCFTKMTVQCLGAIFGTQVATTLLMPSPKTWNDAHLGCFNSEKLDGDPAKIVAWEGIMTFMLILSSLACGLDTPAACGSHMPMVAGMAMIACAISGGKYTGAALNPARLVAPLTVYGCNVHDAPYYLLGQLLGALLAVIFFEWAFGPGPLDPRVSQRALALSNWEAWALLCVGSPPSRLKGQHELREGGEEHDFENTWGDWTIHGYLHQIARYKAGRQDEPEPTEDSDLTDLRLLLGDAILLSERSCPGSSEEGSDHPREGLTASMDVARMLQHPHFSNLESLPETSPLAALR